MESKRTDFLLRVWDETSTTVYLKPQRQRKLQRNRFRSSNARLTAGGSTGGLDVFFKEF